MTEPRIPPLALGDASMASRAILDRTRKDMGMLPNVYRVLAHSDAALASYDTMARALDAGVLPKRLREQIALMTAKSNGCDYCLAAHRVAGRMAKLSHVEIEDAEAGRATDAREFAALRLARELLFQRGDASDATIDHARAHGFGDAEIVEIGAHVAMNIFTNSINRMARTPIDFGRIARAAAEVSARFGKG